MFFLVPLIVCVEFRPSLPLIRYSWSGRNMSSSKSVAGSRMLAGEWASYRLSACIQVSDVRRRALRDDHKR